MDYTKINQQAYGNTAKATYDEGLRAYMLSVYNYMAIALVITGLVAFFVGSNPQSFGALMQPPMLYLILFAPVVMAFFIGPMIMKLSLAGAQAAFWGFAALIGLSISPIFMIYTGESIARTFFISASMFGAMSLYGYTTKKDLTSWGSFLMMGLIGIILASVVNIFLKSPMIHFVTSLIGIAIFVGLTAYDTQRIKSLYYQVAGGGDMVKRVAIMGALSLYMDLINMFMYMLQFMGSRRD